jgi:hypothetical protein
MRPAFQRMVRARTDINIRRLDVNVRDENSGRRRWKVDYWRWDVDYRRWDVNVYLRCESGVRREQRHSACGQARSRAFDNSRHADLLIRDHTANPKQYVLRGQPAVMGNTLDPCGVGCTGKWSQATDGMAACGSFRSRRPPPSVSAMRGSSCRTGP